MTHIHILRIGAAVLTVKVRELPERITAQVFFDEHYEAKNAVASLLFISRIAAEYRKDSRPFCVHEADGKQLMVL